MKSSSKIEPWNFTRKQTGNGGKHINKIILSQLKENGNIYNREKLMVDDKIPSILF